MLLKELSPGARGRIVALRKEQPEYRRRLLMLGATPETMRTTLALAAADTAEAYERLPLVQDAHLMDAILYSGVWAQFNRTYTP